MQLNVEQPQQKLGWEDNGKRSPIVRGRNRHRLGVVSMRVGLGNGCHAVGSESKPRR